MCIEYYDDVIIFLGGKILESRVIFIGIIKIFFFFWSYDVYDNSFFKIYLFNMF